MRVRYAIATGAVVLGVVLASAGGAYLLATVTPQVPTGGGGPGGRWGAVNRDRLAICVQSVNVAESEVSMVRSATDMALWQLTADAAWRDYNDGFPAPVVQEGCPSPPALYDPIAGPYISETLFHVRGRVVDSASYFKVHVYVLPEEEIDRVTGRWRETTEEEFCSFDVCYSVTEGLYVSLSDAKNPDLMRNLVADAIGLR